MSRVDSPKKLPIGCEWVMSHERLSYNIMGTFNEAWQAVTAVQLYLGVIFLRDA